MRSNLCVLWFLSHVWLIGCTRDAPPPKPETNTDSPQQAAVRQEFNRLKAALAALREAKKGADENVWELLGPDSQAAAEKKAKVVKSAYAKLADKDKAEMEKKTGLSAKELADMNGKTFVKSQIFQRKYDKVPDSEVSKITVKGNTASLVFIDPGKNSVTVGLVCPEPSSQPQVDRWKFNLEMPADEE
jgi:hypothetical protein